MPADYWINTLVPLLLFAASVSFTPGPNLVMITASGANFGWQPSMPLYWGVVLGFSFMVLAVALGLGTMFETWPWLHTALKLGGSAYLVWLGIRIATARRTEAGEARGRPFSFTEAALFQWVNPKAVVMAATTATLFMPIGLDLWWAASLVALVSVAVNLPCISLWAAFGSGLRRLLGRPPIRRAFNAAMAAALVATGLWMAAT
ncbi:MAG: LysE family translocator [Pseudomonadota bacterium]